MSSKKFPLLIIALLAVLAAVYFLVLPVPEAPQPQDGVEQVAEDTEADIGAGVSATVVSGFDLEKALEPRILGDTSAPIKISEHSSFTCGHCGHFHQTSFETVKAELIDTGKAYLVFSDFPLNAPALHASMIARCLPEDSDYFNFVQALFEEQESWAHERNYLDILQAKAENYGLDESSFKACLGNEELQKGIVAGAKAAQTQWGVSSTPSFVINNKITITGAAAPEDFISKVYHAAAETTGEAAPASDITEADAEAETEETLTPEPPTTEPAAESDAPEEPEAEEDSESGSRWGTPDSKEE